jgi:hypothetical protein
MPSELKAGGGVIPMKIEDLVDFPALQQLADALWHEGTARGAAVLVGAGFSKNAERPGSDTPEPPLWSDLARDMAMQLYRNARKDAPRDPLRLAEEYRTNFGQAALDEFVRGHIHDGAWEPGPLHRALLDLPWSDVLTTNWDTLLERTPTVEPREFVRSTADLAHGRERRIIKLHGSIGSSEHFIFAEEDYRTYPVRFAAFVNTARQIFIENELCLLGFSGDDPNFLQWSGWVRDHLGESARRIYLAGALGLNQTKRKFLESRNIAPIDLAPLVEGRALSERPAAATALFLDFLAKAKPTPAHDWKPASISAYTFLPRTLQDFQRQPTDADYAASLVDQAARIWETDRKSYPVWLVCPASLRQELQFGTSTVLWRTLGVFSKFQPERCAQILYEIAWRHIVALQPIDPQLVDLLETIADPERPCGLEKRQQLEIALALLRTARQRGDHEGFARWVKILEAGAEQDSELRAQAAYQRCLRARDRLDFTALADALTGIQGRDPVWRLRRAALHCELGQFVEASTLIKAALAELNERQRRDGNSLWVRSRRAWAEWLARAAEQDWSIAGQKPWPLEFKRTYCDPEDEIFWITDEAARVLRKRQDEDVPAVPLFEPGHYTDPSKTVRFRSESVATPLYRLDQLIESVGLPLHLNHYNIVGDASKDAAELAFQATFDWYVWFLRAIGSHLDRLFDRYLGRVAVAALPLDVASALSERVTAAIIFWRGRITGLRQDRGSDFTFAIERLRLFIEVLSRLSTRQDEKVARGSFDLAMDLARDSSLRHPWLFEPIGHLAKYSVLAVAPANRSTLVLAALEFPLSSEKGVAMGPMRWPNPIESFFRTRADRPDRDVRWANRIKQLIDEARAGAAARPEAALRLYYLSSQGALTEEERVSFGAALWSAKDQAAAPLPAGTNLLAHTFAELPGPAGIDPEASVRARLFNSDIKVVLAYPQPADSRQIEDRLNRLREIGAATQGALQPTRDQAASLFSEMTKWRPPTDPDEIRPSAASFLREFHEGSGQSVGWALARMVVPSLDPDDRTEERARALLALISEAQVSSALAALPYFSSSAEDIRQKIIQRIRRGLIGRSFDEVAGSTAAVEIWASLDQANSTSILPQQIVEEVISAVETRHGIGLHALLCGARKLVEMNKLRVDERSRLSEALGDLIAETAYDRIDFDSREATSVSLVRAECVRLARALEDSGAGGDNTATWLKLVEADPLPEVRYALASEDITI